MRPPMRSRASSTSTRRPAASRSRAAVNPAAPAPITMTSRSVVETLHLLSNILAGPTIVPDQYQFEELKSGSGAEFEEFYNIYADSISARERKSKAWISEMVGKAEYKILLLKLNSHVIGFSLLFL